MGSKVATWATGSRLQLAFGTFRSAAPQRLLAKRVLGPAPRAVTPTPPTPSVYQPASNSPDDPEVEAFQRNQAAAPRPSVGEEARTTAALAKHGVLSTLSSASGTKGFPNSSVVEYACDEQGRPILAISTLSAHTPDVQADGRVAFTVTTPAFTGLQDGRLTLQGVLRPAADDSERAALREVYLKKHPGAFYVDFGDFHWFVMDHLAGARYNGGFGNARKLSVEEYLAAQPDPVAAFSAPVCGHMNKDHGQDNIAMVRAGCGLVVERCLLLDLDRLGLNAQVTRGGQTFKARIPFPRPAEDRKSIKEVIVELTKAAAAMATAPVAEVMPAAEAAGAAH